MWMIDKRMFYKWINDKVIERKKRNYVKIEEEKEKIVNNHEKGK